MIENLVFGALTFNHASILHSTRKSYTNQDLRSQAENKFFSLSAWQLLTLLPYCNLSSRIVDRHILAREGDHE